jgi:hypothetical protein
MPHQRLCVAVQHRIQLQFPPLVCRAISVSLICGKLKIFLISEPTPHSQPDSRTQIFVASLLSLHHFTAVEAANQEIIRGASHASAQKKKCLPSFFS